MRLLTVTTLYPNAARPHFGTFVETRFLEVVRSGHAQAVVIAPVPWFPFSGKVFGRFGRAARTPCEERRHGVRVLHPRFVTVPWVGTNFVAWSLAAAIERSARQLRSEGYDFDVIDAHYFYPDGVAAALAARRLGRPLVVTARGSDLNLFGEQPVALRMMLAAACQARAVITVSQALRCKAELLGIDPAKIVVLRNGVDVTLFTPDAREPARARLGLAGRTMLSVGNLVELKGHDLVIRSLLGLPDAHLCIVGEGPEERALKQLASDLGVAARVRFVSPMPQAALAEYYAAADVLVLASSREGWPNVLLESMACGTPVIASDVGGCREVVAVPEAGRLLPERTSEAIVSAVRALTSDPPARSATRRYAEGFGWEAITAGQLRVFAEAVAGARDRAEVIVECTH